MASYRFENLSSRSLGEIAFCLVFLLGLPSAFVLVGTLGAAQAQVQVQRQTGSSASGSHQSPEKPGAVSGAPGMMIYIDPQTGALLKEPAPGTVPLQLTPQLQNALSTSDQGLVEVPSSVPGGGVTVDLQGRFQSPLIATTDANGKVKIQHLHEMLGTNDKK